MTVRYSIFDVFTDDAFAGNPLAVVYGADALSDETMQMIAGEFNLSETVFIREPEGREADWGLRIFTPKAELPFAGHPTVGAAVALALDTGQADKTRRFVLEEKVGDVTANARVTGERSGAAQFFLPRLSEQVGDLPDLSEIAAVLGLKTGDLLDTPITGGLWSAGVPFAIVPVRHPERLTEIHLDLARFEAVFGTCEAKDVLVVAKATASEHTLNWRTRMFAPLLGILEDPATGSAAAAFSGLIAQQCGLGDGTHGIDVYQGVEMGRPSLIRMRLEIEGGRLNDVLIGGEAVQIAAGELFV